MKHKTIKKRKMARECWNLDYTFIVWLNQRLPIYLRQAGRIINLDFHKFTYNNKEYTQRELTEYLAELCNDVVHDKFDAWDDPDKYKSIFEIWGIIAPYTWW